MNCNEFEKLLADYLGNELSVAQRKNAEQHINQCESCSREVTSLLNTIAKLHNTTSPQPSIRTKPTEFLLRSFLSGSLRYVAVLAFGVFLGWDLRQSRPSAIVATPQVQTPVSGQVAWEYHPGWIQAAVQADRRHVGDSSLVRHLAILSAARSSHPGKS